MAHDRPPRRALDAREEATRLLGKVADGIDPSAVKQAKRKAATVAELCDLYLADAEAGRLLTRRKVPKKASTLAIDRGRVARHIKPLLGQMKVAAVRRCTSHSGTVLNRADLSPSAAVQNYGIALQRSFNGLRVCAIRLAHG
jgi:hypothetical protein